MVSFPNAKINIGLNIIEKRKDGFHNLESIFYPIALKDMVEVISSAADTVFTSSGIPIKSDGKDNLCLRAYQLLTADFNLPPVQIHLHKTIPIGAGLGGGSADAAFIIKMLNDLFELGLSWGELHHYAKQLGSDCSFFITNKPAWVQGRGDDYEGVDLNLSEYKLALVYPDIHISTIEAYSFIKPEKKNVDMQSIILKQPVESWKQLVVNDFEAPIFNKYPAIGEIKDQLYQSGAIYASMSGSGSAVFGIFKEQVALPDHLTKFRFWWI